MFLINKLVYRFIFGAVYENHINDLEKGFTKMRRAAFGDAAGFNVYVSRLVRWSVHPGESGDCFATMKSAGIADLCDQLRSENLSNTKHLHNNVVFGKLFRKRGHLLLQLCESFTGAVQLCSRLCQQCSYVITVRERWNERFGIVIYCIRFAVGVIVTVLVMSLCRSPNS